MAVTSAIVLYAVTWFMTMLVALPVGLRTQGDENEVLPGTHASSPARLNLKRKMLIVSAISLVIWGILVAAILSGKFPISQFNWMDRLGPVGG